ncbi:MAG: FAD-dependent oxidoreductase [Planctomycetia bacterium]|nr:FAD-dependent oxidoreductase [Planctomycetia bacterium]
MTHLRTWRVLLLAILFIFSVSLTAASTGTFETTRIDLVKVDVLVVGGGSAGVPAAIQAARAGAQTVLVEAGSQLGGNATAGGVNFPGLFHAWGKQVIAGIGWEWVVKTVETQGGELPDFTQPTGRQHWRHQIRVNPYVYLAVAEELCHDAGVELRYYEAPTKIDAITDSVYNWRVLTHAQGQARVILCKELIDCTGNGAVAKLVGAQLLREDVIQPGTFNYKISHKINLQEVDQKEIQRRYAEALKEGTIHEGDARGGIISFLGNSENNYVFNADNTTASLRTQTNMQGRAAMLRMLRFIRTLPGGETAAVVSMSPEVGVRETQRVLGDYLITCEDYVEGKVWDDSIAYSFYPIDLHENQTGVHPRSLEEGTVPTIPARALFVKDKSHILVAGRCISSDRLANSALRVQASCMASGQAVGALAAIAAKENIEPRQVQLQEVKELLKEHGAIVP